MTIRVLVVRVRRVLIAAVTIALLGYLSSIVSRSGSERATAERVADELGQRDVFVLAADGTSPIDYPGSAAILVRGGFKVRQCHESGSQFNCFPWAGVSPARIVGPFVVDVRWGYAAVGLSGCGTRTRYLVLFGFVCPLRDLGGWVS
jgi:hypothetical protein